MTQIPATSPAEQPVMTAGVMKMTPQSAKTLMQGLQGARALLRAVILAEAARADQSIDWGPNNNGPERWSPVIGEVCRRLQAVREIVLNTCGFYNLDWPVLLLTAEALDATLWHGCVDEGDALNSDELVAALHVLIALLDEALVVCADEGVPTRAAERGLM